MGPPLSAVQVDTAAGPDQARIERAAVSTGGGARAFALCARVLRLANVLQKFVEHTGLSHDHSEALACSSFVPGALSHGGTPPIQTAQPQFRGAVS
jgi:hypothetical protein